MSKRALLKDDFFRMRPMPGGEWYVAADRRRAATGELRGHHIMEFLLGQKHAPPVRAAPLRSGATVELPPLKPVQEGEGATRPRPYVKPFLSHYLDLAPKFQERRFQPL